VAGPVAAAGRDNPIQLLEDSLNLLRQAKPGTLLYHWIGSAPFALGLLRFWNDVTNPRTPGTVCLVESLALAALLVWMNCWRAVFAGRLRRQLGGAADPLWTRRRIYRLIAAQSFFGATKLLVLPFATLITFPLAVTVAFYRNLAVLADREELDPLDLMAQARRFSRIQTRQGWLLLPLLTFLQLVVAINVAICLAVLPQLTRMLTGWETVFSRSGSFYIMNPLFAILVLVMSWMAFDPFVQAVYCVRCFRAESVETGEDVRAGLRRIRSAAAGIAAAIFLLAFAPHAAAVSRAELEIAVQQSMQAHEYDWRLPPEGAASGGKSWLVALTDRMIASSRAFFHSLGKALARFLQWLAEKLRGVVPDVQGGASPAAGLHWSIYVLTAIVVLGLAGLIWRYRRLRRVKAKPAADSLTPIRLDAEDLSPDRLPEENWLTLADQCLREGNLRLALRALYLANLAWLGRREIIAIHAGKTNREYEIDLRRRTRAFPEVRTLFAVNIAIFERTWYGMHEVTPAGISDFRERVGRMKATLAAQEVAA
jgi:hypothetical protein